MNGSIAYLLVFILTLFPYNIKAQETPFFLLTKDEPLPQKNTEAKDQGSYIPKAVPYADWLIRRAEIVRSDLIKCQQEYIRYKDDLSEKGKIELNWVFLKTKKKLEYLVFLENKFKTISGVSFADAGYDYGFDSVDEEFSELKEKALSFTAAKKAKAIALVDKTKDIVVSLKKEANEVINTEKEKLVALTEVDAGENSETQAEEAQKEDLVKKEDQVVEKTKSDSVDFRVKASEYYKKVSDLIKSGIASIFKRDQLQNIEKLDEKEMELATNEPEQAVEMSLEPVTSVKVLSDEPKNEKNTINKEKTETIVSAEIEKKEDLKVLKAKIKKCETNLAKAKKENESIKREISSLKEEKVKDEKPSEKKETEIKEKAIQEITPLAEPAPVKEQVMPSTSSPETAPIELLTESRLEQKNLEEEKQKLKEREAALAEYEKKLKEMEESIKKEKEERERLEKEELVKQEELAKAKAAEEKRLNEEREAKLAKEREDKEKEEKLKALVEEEKRLSIELIEKRKKELGQTHKDDSGSIPALEKNNEKSDPAKEKTEKEPAPSEVKEDKKTEAKEIELDRIVNKEESPVIEQDSNRRTRIIEDGELQEANGPKF
jgi:hypothetical protein